MVESEIKEVVESEIKEVVALVVTTVVLAMGVVRILVDSVKVDEGRAVDVVLVGPPIIGPVVSRTPPNQLSGVLRAYLSYDKVRRS